jgi:hypothetical protein
MAGCSGVGETLSSSKIGTTAKATTLKRIASMKLQEIKLMRWHPPTRKQRRLPIFTLLLLSW